MSQFLCIFDPLCWVEIFSFAWANRKKYRRIVDRIGNRKFAEHAQFYLHEWGKRKLGYLTFDEGGLIKYVYGKLYRLEYPQSLMPENIKFFNNIEINHFDAQTIDFLDKLRPLLTGVEIAISEIPTDHLENLRTILTTMAPMLGGIQSLYCSDDSGFSMVKEHFFREAEKLAKLKMLRINFYTQTETEQPENVNFLTNWLSQPDTDGPKLFKFNSGYRFYEQLIKAIREQFHAANSRCTFAVNFKRCIWQKRRTAEFHLSNDIGEELHGEWIEIEWEEDVFQITRHPANWNTKEAREWIEQMTKKVDYPCIWIENQPTIGSINTAAQIDTAHLDEKQDNQEKPCSSKDA